MAKPQLTKSWTISPNVRYTPFVSLNACMGWFLYEHKRAMLAAGFTVKFSSDGTTGPASAADTTDRWASQSSGPLTRATVAAAVQSWIVMQNVDGVQTLLTYQGASDDIARISMSQSGAFTLAGTTTHQPTATDEVICTSTMSVINATASGDRVMHMGCTTESWWSATLRAGSWVQFMGIEKIDPACDTAVLAQPYVVCRYTNLNIGETIGLATGGIMNVSIGASTWHGQGSRVYTSGAFRAIRVGGGQITHPRSAGNSAWTFSTPGAMQPSLQNGNGTILLPIHWFGEETANLQGYFGKPIDWWYGWGTSVGAPSFGDMITGLDPGDTQGTALRSNWLIAFGAGVIRPWRNAAASAATS